MRCGYSLVIGLQLSPKTAPYSPLHAADFPRLGTPCNSGTGSPQHSAKLRPVRSSRGYHRFSEVIAGIVVLKRTVETLNQAALQTYFYPGNDRVNDLAKRLAHGADSIENYCSGRFLCRSIFIFYPIDMDILICGVVQGQRKGRGQAENQSLESFKRWIKPCI